MEDCYERVAAGSGVTQDNPLGLFVVKGDNVCVVGRATPSSPETDLQAFPVGMKLSSSSSSPFPSARKAVGLSASNVPTFIVSAELHHPKVGTQLQHQQSAPTSTPIDSPVLRALPGPSHAREDALHPAGLTHFQFNGLIPPEPPSLEVASAATAPSLSPSSSGPHVNGDRLGDGDAAAPLRVQPGPPPPSSEPPQFKRHALLTAPPPAPAAPPDPSAPPLSQQRSNPPDSHLPLHEPAHQSHLGQLLALQQQFHTTLPPPSVTAHSSSVADDHLLQLMALQRRNSSSYDQSHVLHLMALQKQFNPDPPTLSSDALHFQRHAAQPATQCRSTAPLQQPPTPKAVPTNYRLLWLNKYTRNSFLCFFVVFIMWVALDVLFHVLFGVETYRIIPSDIPGASPLRHFFPAALVFLIISFLITTFANARVFRRVVLISASEHQLESQGTNRLVWEELFPMIVVVFHTIIFVSTANTCKSAVRRSVGIYKWFIVTGNPAIPSASRSPTMLSKFLVVGPLTAAASFVHLPKTVPVILRSLVTLLSLSLTGKWAWCDALDRAIVFPQIVAYLSQRAVQSCAGGVRVDFCDSAAKTQSSDGYLVFLSSRVVRPIASLFNFKTRMNPDADIDVVDPLECGYFERVTKWWSNYEAWQESTALSFVMFVPFFILAVALTLLQMIASLFLVVFHVTVMLLQLLCLPVLFPLGYAYCVPISFWRSVKYLTGAICIFSPNTPSLRFHTETTDLKRYSSNCCGVCSLHALHVSAFQVGDIPYRFKIAFLIFGIVFYPVRAVMLTLASFVICAMCWIAAFLFQFVLGIGQFCAFVLAVAFGIFSFVFLLVATVVYVILSPFVFLFALTLLFAWFLISMLALIGMELLCLMSAMTNPEAGLILYSNVSEMRYKLAAVAGLFEDFPCLILQAYYTALVGTRGTAGKCRIISLALASFRMCVLTSIRAFKMHKFAREKKALSATPIKSWEAEQHTISNCHSITSNILFNFRSSLFPDRFSAVLRIVIFGMYAAFFGWLGSQNLYTPSGSAVFMNSNFPVPVVCGSTQVFTVCDVNAHCEGDACVCNTGYGGSGANCLMSRPGTCNPVISQCAYAATCRDTPGGFTCPCPSWTTPPIGGSAFYGSGNISSDMCTCDTLSFPNLNLEKGACVTTLNLTEGEVAALMLFVGYIPLLMLFLLHWKLNTRGGKVYPKHWKWLFACLLLTLISVSLGLYLGGITSMMVLVVCFPIVLLFIAHWKWLTRDGTRYPTKWKVAFAILFITLLCLSLGLMYGNVLTSNVEKYRNQAAIMIFAVCVPIVLAFLLYWQYTTRGGAKPPSEKKKRRRRIIFLIIFIAIFALSLGLMLGLSSQPRINSFVIASSDRKAGKVATAVTLTFTPANTVPSGGTMTLSYPSSFFVADVIPVLPAGSSSVGSLTGTCGATTATSFVITTAGATIPAAAITVTLGGLTLGSLTDGAVDVAIQTSADTLVSPAIASGGIFPPISDVAFKIPSTDRVSGKPNVPLTVQFTPANPIPPGGKITISYPSAFFVPSVTPVVMAGDSSVAGLTGSCSSTSPTSVVITTSGVTIPSAAFTVTIAGFTMGSVTTGSVSVKIETSADVLPSLDVFSGGIYTQVTNMTMTIGTSDRIAGRPAVSVTVTFAPTNTVPAAGSITLSYPSGFFAELVTPTVTAGKSSIASLTATCGSTTATSMVITTAGATILAAAAFTVTISGFTMGPVTAGSVAVTVQTSADTLPSVAAQSGSIVGQVSSVVFAIATSNRIAGKPAVPLVLSFVTSTLIPIGGTITFTYPPAFFAPSITPTVAAGSSSVAGLTGTCSATAATYIIITTAGSAAPASSITITIYGFTIGAVTAGAISVTVQTSADTLPSAAVDSGQIVGGTVTFATSPSFAVASSDRIAGKSPVAITVGFTPTTMLPIGGTATISYPAAFFAASITPTVVVGGSSTPGLTVTCGATTATSFIITTAGAAIATAAFTVTISGFTMGAVTPGAVAVTVETSADTVPSAAVSSGNILGQLASLSFVVSLHDRIVAKSAVPLTLSFTSSTLLPSGGTITLTYPPAFFAPSITPTVAAGSSSVAGLTGTCSATTATYIIITTAGAAIPASAVTVTVTGLTMGDATAGTVGVTLSSSADTLPSSPVSSGAIFGQVNAVSFLIASSDRIAAKTNVPVTLVFTPSTLLVAGSTITLSYPSAFFATTIPTVTAGKSSIASLTATCGSTTATSMVITTAGATIPAAAAFTVTISGFTLGPVTAGTVGVTVETSADTLPSAAVSSGGIFTQVTFVSFAIASNDRIAGKTAVSITFGFSATTLLLSGGTITLNYPPAFFAPGVAPSPILAGTSSVAALTGTCSTTTATSVVITTAAADIPASAVVITVGGFTLGAVTAGSVDVTVATSADTRVSAAVASGAIVGQVSSVSFAVQSTDRIAARAAVPVTVGFTLTTAVPIGGTITLNYPSSFFASSVTPSAISAGSSSVAALTGTCGTTTATSFVITTAAAPIPVAALVVTIRGLRMGPVTPGAVGVNVQTSSDTQASLSVTSGTINGQVAAVSFTIADSDRIVAKTAVPVTLAFTLSTLLPIAGTITLSFPSGFFSTSAPLVAAGSSSVAGFSGTCAPSTPTSVIITTAGAAVPASAFVVTMSGFIMGAATTGQVNVTVQTSADAAVSDAVASGGIYTQVTLVTFTIDQADRIAFKTSVPVTLGFTPTTAVPIGSSITVTYPAAFFSPSVTPSPISASSVAGLTGTCSATASTSIVITTAVAVIPVAAFVVTISGFTMGAATAGAVAVFVQTSVDPSASAPASSGSIIGRVSAVSFAIATSDRISGKSAVPVTVGFTPITPVPIGGTVTLTYPTAFFAASVTPTVAAGSSSVVGLTGVCGATSAASVIITAAGAAIPASAFVVTITGITMGAVTPGAVSVTVQTSSDTSASVAVTSGAIFGQVSSVTFVIAASNRFAAKTSVPVTLSFTPFSPLPLGGTITMTYPSAFFAASATPTIAAGSASVSAMAGTCSAPAATALIITTSGAALTTAAFTVTISSFTMGAATAGSVAVSVQTSADTAASTSVSSGGILTPGSLLQTYTHPNWLRSVMWSPDGTKIVTTCDDKFTRVWGSSGGSPLLTLAGHINLVYTAVFSPDGTKIATSSDDNTVRVWNSASGASLLVLTGHTDYVRTVAWSPDGSKLLTASYDRKAIIWNSNTGSAMVTMTGHTTFLVQAAWSPDGTKVATASGDDTARVWNSSSGAEFVSQRLTGHNGDVNSVAWSPDGTKIATGSSDFTAKIWSSSSGAPLLTLAGHTNYVRSVTWSPDGTRIATSGDDNTAKLWSSSGGAALMTIGPNPHTDWAYWVSFSPDGSQVATASYDRTARIWNAV